MEFLEKDLEDIIWEAYQSDMGNMNYLIKGYQYQVKCTDR